MAIQLEMPEQAAAPQGAVETESNEAINEQEREAAEFIARQVLDRGATFFDG